MKNSKHQILLAEKFENRAFEMPVGLVQLAVFPEVIKKRGKTVVSNKITNTVMYTLAGCPIRTKCDAFVFNSGNIVVFYN